MIGFRSALSGFSSALTRSCLFFGGPVAMIFDDEWHSNGEQREIIIGHSDVGRLEAGGTIQSLDNQNLHCGSGVASMGDVLRRFLEVGGFCVGDVGEGLGVAVD